MSFCTACGCERTGANYYCNGCGAAFGESADTGNVRLLSSWTSDGPGSAAPSGAATRPDVGIGLIDSLFSPPDPSWDDWYVQPKAEEKNPVRPVRRPRRSGWRKRVVIALVGVVVAVAWSGAAVFELGHGHARHGARSGARAGAGGSRAALHPGAPRPAASVTPGGSRDSRGASDVAVGPAAAGNPALPQVMGILHRYFSAINGHDYAEFAQLLDPQFLVRLPASAFDSGYGSTTDSHETLTGISALDSGGLAAALTFTSHQRPAASPDHSACTDWSITLYLVPNGAGYLIGLPPPGYRASYTSC